MTFIQGRDIEGITEAQKGAEGFLVVSKFPAVGGGGGGMKKKGDQRDGEIFQLRVGCLFKAVGHR